MAFECLGQSARGGVPDFDGSVGSCNKSAQVPYNLSQSILTAAGNPFPIRRKLDGSNATLVSSQRHVRHIVQLLRSLYPPLLRRRAIELVVWRVKGFLWIAAQVVRVLQLCIVTTVPIPGVVVLGCLRSLPLGTATTRRARWSVRAHR